MAYDVVVFFTNQDGVAYPNSGAVNASGPAATDGTELVAGYMNNYAFGRQQALLNYAGLTPTGVVESNTVSQELEAIEKGFAVGPGMSSVRYINASPAVNGDRTLILAEQGVLIASYVALDAKTWITGNTAAQVAAAAAGEKFYRSSDAGGATGDAAGPYLQLPAQPQPGFLKQYLGDGTDFSVTSDGTGWVTNSVSLAIPYQTIDGAWRLIFNIVGTLSASSASHTITISNVVFKSVAAFLQATTAAINQSDWSNARVTNGTGQIELLSGTAATGWRISGDVELNAKPTWADDFEMPWCITY